MSFLQNRKVTNNLSQFPSQSLVRSQPISYKANFSQRHQMHLEDHKKKKNKIKNKKKNLPKYLREN